ncbi:hypothetical protein K2173_002078 [Erythroxylum novogranatense]|uniref:Uncharacterized protein n=1 Tax=Erythroxylum novogranatense TaxID=1862640 RepID=A0AAV8SQD9_9ROSI|nr:hypothetical protein K2173_002078 [Erythroxylum novogranatense]
MSLTLRLLSLQNKGCVCVDEVYVFADPIDETDLYNTVGGAGYPAGGSFMAMFMPSLLQLSKLKGASQDDKYRFDTKEWQKSEDTESETTKTNEARNELQQKGKPNADRHESSKLSSELMAKPVQLENLPQVSGTKAEIDASQSHSNGVVNQLVLRLNRLEDILLRFEENMLKPINSIDERLQCVERQLEVLSKKAQNVELLSCTRISAPELSCSESETNSFYNSGSVCVNYLPCEGNKETPGFPSNSPIATTFSVASELHPSLVVTAPAFSNCDDEEENEEVEQVTEPPEDKFPQIMSIDDALAAAIAGFLSSTSIQCEKFSEIPAVQAQEFTNEEISIGNSVSPSVHFQMASDRDICVTSLCQTENRGAFSSLSHIAAAESDNALCPDDGICVNTGELCCEEECDSQGSCIDHAILSGTPMMKRTDSYQLADNVEDHEIVDGKKKILVIAKTDSLEEFPETKIYEDSDTSWE